MGEIVENSQGNKQGGNLVKTSRQSASSSLEAGKFTPNIPLDGKLFDLFASLLQLAELHGRSVLKSIARDFNTTLLRHHDNRIGDRAPDLFITIKQQCQRMIQLRTISEEVRTIFQQHLEYIEQQVGTGRVKRQRESALAHDEEISESCD